MREQLSSAWASLAGLRIGGGGGGGGPSWLHCFVKSEAEGGVKQWGRPPCWPMCHHWRVENPTNSRCVPCTNRLMSEDACGHSDTADSGSSHLISSRGGGIDCMCKSKCSDVRRQRDPMRLGEKNCYCGCCVGSERLFGQFPRLLQQRWEISVSQAAVRQPLRLLRAPAHLQSCSGC